MKWFYVAALLVVTGLVLSPLGFLPDRAEEDYAGRMVYRGSYGAEIKSLDPATCGDTTSSGMQGNCYEGLYCYHYLKRPVEVIPQLAGGMPEISSDRLTYTIRLKPGVRYARNPCFGSEEDGRPGTREVRAEDFVLAFKRVADYHINTGLAWAFLSGRIVGLDAWRVKSQAYQAGDFSRYDLPVEGITAPDELTFRIRLTEPFPQMVQVLAMHVYAPIPPEAVDYWLGTEADGKGGRRGIALKDRSTEFREAEQVVSTGPYVMKEFRRRDRIVFARNPEFRQDYYPTEGAPGDREAGLLDDAGKAVPFMDVMRLDCVPEDYSSWMRFLSRQVEASGIPRENFDFVVTPDKELAEKWRKRHIYLSKYESPSVYWIVFNMEDPIVGASKSLRQALCLAYDVANHIEVLYNGRGVRAVNIIPRVVKGHGEAGPGPYYRLDLEAAKLKIAQAKAELAEAGMLVDGEIPELKLDLGSNDRGARLMAEFARQQLAKVGVRLKAVYNDWPTLQQKVHNKQVQMYTMGWHADYPDAENFLQLFYSPNIARGTNNANYANPDFDRLYEQIRTMPDTLERTEIYARMANMISEDCPVLLLSEPISYVLYYDWVRNVKHHPVGYGFTKYRRIDTALRSRLTDGKR